jgi:hypothetical protein
VTKLPTGLASQLGHPAFKFLTAPRDRQQTRRLQLVLFIRGMKPLPTFHVMQMYSIYRKHQ